MYFKNKNAKIRAIDTNKELKALEERKEILHKNLSRIKTTKGIEMELRKKFDVAKEGEHVIVVIDKEVKPAITTEKETGLLYLWHKFKNSL